MVGNKKWWNFPDLSPIMFPQICTWKKCVQLHTQTQEWSFSKRAWVYVHLCTLLWSSKVWHFPVCLGTSNRLVKRRLFVSIPGKCCIKNKRASKNMALQEDAWSVALYRWMCSVCRTLRLGHRKLHIENIWMPKKLISEVTCGRRLVETGNGHGDWSQGLLFLLTFLLQKCISDLSCMRGNLSFWSTGLDFHFSLMLGTVC